MSDKKKRKRISEVTYDHPDLGKGTLYLDDEQKAEWESVQSWHPTNELRWINVDDADSGDTYLKSVFHPNSLVLQQKWISNHGNVEWREIEIEPNP